jgi:hypothetical protein
VFVGAHPVSEVTPWKEPNATSDSRQRGIALQRCTLGGDSFAVHPIVGVHARHKLPPTLLYAIYQCGNEASMGSNEQPEPRVGRRKLPGDIDPAIRRPIVHHDALPIGVGLALDAAQAGGQRFGRVEYGQENRGSGGMRHDFPGFDNRAFAEREQNRILTGKSLGFVCGVTRSHSGVALSIDHST